jgi:hypothetical protein
MTVIPALSDLFFRFSVFCFIFRFAFLLIRLHIFGPARRPVFICVFPEDQNSSPVKDEKNLCPRQHR